MAGKIYEFSVNGGIYWVCAIRLDNAIIFASFGLRQLGISVKPSVLRKNYKVVKRQKGLNIAPIDDFSQSSFIFKTVQTTHT